MPKKLSTWKFFLKNLEANIYVMLLYVLESKGSSPGRRGFFMGVNEHGEMAGSIGGGVMEHKFVELAKNRLSENSDTTSIHKQIHDKSVATNQSGMICSGEQTIFLYKLLFEDLPVIKRIIQALEINQTELIQLSDKGISILTKVENQQEGLIQTEDGDWNYSETIGLKDHLHIIGGGHCALALSQLMSTMDFYIHLYEDRNGLNTVENNHCVHEKRIVKNYDELTNLIPSGNNVYVVIMTFGYRSDDTALRALMNKDFKYIGCLGSKKKIEKMIAAYQNEGLNTTWLNKVYAPIGLQIKSETPEEIAVSIAAEIIKVKNAG